MSKRDFYEVLGVDKTANEQEIKKAYDAVGTLPNKGRQIPMRRQSVRG